MSMNKSSSQEMTRSAAGKTRVSLSQGIALVTVLLLFLMATVVAFTQLPRFNALQPPTFAERLFYPWETHAFRRLPIIIGDLNDVFVLPDSQLVWVVGNGGLILHSKDGGITWVQQPYPGGAPAKNAAAIPLSFVDQLSLFPKAMAGIKEDPEAQYSNVADSKQVPVQKNIERPSSAETQTYQQSNAPDSGASALDTSNISTQSSPTDPGQITQDDRLPDLSVVYFEDAKNGIVLSADGINLGTTDGGATWQKNVGSRQLEEQARDASAYSAALAAGRGEKSFNNDGMSSSASPDVRKREIIVAVGSKGSMFKIINGSRWQEQKKYTDSNLNGIELIDDESWILVGDDGLIAKSNDNGEIWHPLSRGTFSWLGAVPLTEEELLIEENAADAANYRRFPAPWYWIVCCLMIVYSISFFLRKGPHPEPQQEDSIADLLASDRPLRPGDPDPLGYNAIACGLSRFMRNPSTEPPLTLAVTGAWGSGKSSLMNLLYYDLKKFGFTPVWFNAWHHQKGEQLLASLYANIRNQAVPGLFSFSQLIPVGLMFRINLLFRRGVKHWLVTVILIGVFAASATYLLTHRESSSLNVNKITEALITPGFNWETLLIALFGNVAPLMALLQALRAFGLNPLSLMTAQGDRQAQTRVDPSARQQFAREFNEVAKSLSLGRMVIFIDDLDRCSRENVVDILEAINFLSVSGDCYIVLGMDETWVKICINKYFGDMSDRNPNFADEYLEKMINIKVPVPQLSDYDSSKLLAWELPDTEHNDIAPAVQMWRTVKTGLHPYRYFLLMVCVLVLGACFGFLLDSIVRSEPKTPSPQQTIATWNNIEIDQLSMVGGNPDFTVRVQENTAPSPDNPASAWELSLNATEEDLKKGIVIGKLGDGKTSAALVLKAKASAQAASITNSDDAPEDNPSESRATKFHNGQQDSSYWDYWMPLVAGILLALGVVAYMMKMPVRRPKDSADFKQALEIWKPWILLNRQTPRAIKRYLNRVRYMAMRYRTEAEPQAIGMKEALARLFHKPDADEQHAPTSDAQFEANLVALSAIQAVEMPWAANLVDIGQVQLQDLQELVKNKFGEHAGSSDKAAALVQRLADAIEKHRTQFGDTVAADDEKQKKFEKVLADMQAK
ncbi:MAG: hypothetical protein K0Q78_206 [Cellvibrio sp.]|nr:hypothetical protein [Cellvibrio sp.]